MTLIYIFIFIFIFFNPYGRIAILNLPLVIFYLPRDIYFYFKHKKWRNLNTGKIRCYCAPDFGGGKTLSATAWIEDMYNRYNDVIVWDFSRKKYVRQVVQIVSNVEFLNIPWTKFDNVFQICNCSTASRLIDEVNDTLTCTIFFIDEASSELNSRSFKDNLNAFVLKDIVTCRHNHISIILTSQDFKMIDALMRTVTSSVLYAFKTWRLLVQKHYDPKELENAGSYRLIKCIKTGGFFVRDKHYGAYDTHAVVDKLNKRIEEGDLLSAEEILASLGDTKSTEDAILRPSKGLRRMIQKKNKYK